MYIDERVGPADSPLSLEDLLQDAFGYLAGALLETTPAVPAAFRSLLSRTSNPVADFFNSRFDGSDATLRAACHYVATSDEPQFWVARGGITTGWPMSAAEAEEFASGVSISLARYR